MACQCKVNQQLDYLHRKYGDNTPQNKKTNIRGNVLASLENFGIFVLTIPLMPFMAVYAIFKLLVGGIIHIG